MATHSSTLAWKIPWTEEPGGLPSMGSDRVRHDWSDLAAAADCSTSGFPLLNYLLEFAQTHVHWVGDVIQPSHPLWLSSPPDLNLSQHHGLFQEVSSSHQVANVLEFQLQHQSFQWIFRTDFLSDGLVGSPCSPKTLKSLLQHHNSKASILRHLAFLCFNSHTGTWLLEKP